MKVNHHTLESPMRFSVAKGLKTREGSIRLGRQSILHYKNSTKNYTLVARVLKAAIQMLGYND